MVLLYLSIVSNNTLTEEKEEEEGTPDRSYKHEK